MRPNRLRQALLRGLLSVLLFFAFSFTGLCRDHLPSAIRSAAVCREEVWSPPSVPVHRGVYFGVKDGVLCAGGGFTILPFIVDRMIGLMEGKEIHTLVVDSQGGHIGSAVRFGWEIDAN